MPVPITRAVGEILLSFGLSAAHFNRIARERGLSTAAAARDAILRHVEGAIDLLAEK